MTAAFKVNDVEHLLAMMERWAIAELHLTVGDAAIDLVRNSCTVAPSHEDLPIHIEYDQSPPVCEEIETHTIFATLVGMLHLATAGFPNGKPDLGDIVHSGQVIGKLESMSVFTELYSPVSGVIISLPVEDNVGVEYGQPLMVIRPLEEDNDYETI